ncbi:tRNA (guanine(46)-N(7))-methyltransferase TrmB [Anderseniella sp. Alg231-50]|uniref:tRNA (guanine(46)-N(7))-methyltransferase TrmB n=1 Tax=Anderseniella sp. Alg231-50 TaxID=1922226 RepID=UPI000D562E2A
MSQPPDRPRFAEKFFGRRSGQALRDNQVRLVENLLPKLRVPDRADSLRDPGSLFESPVSEIWLEIGFGGGEHLAWQAAANPHVGFIGGEPFINGVAKLLSLVESGALANVRIIDNDIRPRMDQLGDQTISRAFLLFPDPWPKLRHHKRRFVNRTNLDRLHRIMKPGAEFRVASDIDHYIQWSLHEVAAHGGFRLLSDNPADRRRRPADWPQTRYEAKAVREGRTSEYLRIIRV